MLTKHVAIVAKIQVTPDFKNLDNLAIWILSDKLETIEMAVAINKTGKIKIVIAFEIKTIENNIMGCISVTDVIFPRSWH